MRSIVVGILCLCVLGCNLSPSNLAVQQQLKSAQEHIAESEAIVKSLRMQMNWLINSVTRLSWLKSKPWLNARQRLRPDNLKWKPEHTPIN